MYLFLFLLFIFVIFPSHLREALSSKLVLQTVPLTLELGPISFILTYFGSFLCCDSFCSSGELLDPCSPYLSPFPLNYMYYICRLLEKVPNDVNQSVPNTMPTYLSGKEIKLSYRCKFCICNDTL